MANKKNKGRKPDPGGDRVKPTRMIRIPEAFALALELMADEQFNTLTEQVKIGLREYLEKHNRLPKPGT